MGIVNSQIGLSLCRAPCTCAGAACLCLVACLFGLLGGRTGRNTGSLTGEWRAASTETASLSRSMRRADLIGRCIWIPFMGSVLADCSALVYCVFFKTNRVRVANPAVQQQLVNSYRAAARFRLSELSTVFNWVGLATFP